MANRKRTKYNEGGKTDYKDAADLNKKNSADSATILDPAWKPLTSADVLMYISKKAPIMTPRTTGARLYKWLTAAQKKKKKEKKK